MSVILPFATGPFFSLNNTDFVVTIGFILFVGILVYAKVPGKVTAMLDARAQRIQTELNDARALREEAQSLLASYERKQKEVADQAAAIVAAARHEAEDALKLAKEDLAASMDRRLKAATDQIASAENAAVREVKDRAVTVAVQAAAKVIADKMDAAKSGKMIDDAIATVGAKLH